MEFDKIAVVDFGGQYAHLIATKVRRLRVLCEILLPDAPLSEFAGYRGIILSGSPAKSSHGESSDYTRELFDLPVPVLGLCFGHQEIAKHYGGSVQATRHEYGRADLHIVAESPLLRGLEPVETVWMSHGDTVTSLPPEFVELGFSTMGQSDTEHRFAAIGSDTLQRYGFQFHPEVDDTVHGQQMLQRFVLDVCGCRPEWTVEAMRDQIDRSIRATVGDRRVLLLVSGGVDSTVTAKLLADALGADRLDLVHIDNGLMRKSESSTVVEELTRLGLGSRVHHVDAADEFLTALAGVVAPEAKRRIIGDTFVEVSNRQARDIDLDEFVLGQGTIYPDRIETGGTRHADVIKTHHNRVPIIEQMIADGRIVEPLADLYKVEVRELGRELGIADALLDRHPFPGPGLGIRCLCSEGAAENLDAPTAALTRTLVGSPFRGCILPVRSVGVKGDLRSYEHPVLLQTDDVNPWLDDHGWDELLTLATRIYKYVPGINRVVVEFSGANIGRATPIAASLTRERLDLLREIDVFVMEGLARHGLMKTVWQCPTVLLPVRLGDHGTETVLVRPVLSERGMTARPAPLPSALCQELAQFAAGFAAVSGVVLDLTTKPPGTIEWE